MPDEKKQFRILFHAFLGRIFDLELLSTGSESQNLLITFAALLGAFNFVVAFILVPRYGLSTQPQSVLAINAWHDEEFLIATTLAIVAFLMVLSWETLIPDRRDCIALGVLPVRSRTVLLAKLGAIGCAVVAAVVVVNIFTSFCYPMILLPNGRGALSLLRTFFAYWITMIAAGLFIACTVLSIQGILNQILPYRMFLRVSALLQMSCFLLVLTVYFLKPPLATPKSLLALEHSRWLLRVPSYWFFGLFHRLNGSAPGRGFDWLALRSLSGLVVSVGGAAIAYALGYARTMRRIIEQPDILPAERSRRSGAAVRWFQRRVFKDPLTRAVVLFITRTLARSRQHRLLIAFYSGIGLAIALAYYNSWLEENARGTWQARMAFITPSLLLLFFVVLAVRASFSFPHTLPANWIFRITLVHRPAEYLEAVRSSLYLIAAFPIWISCALLFFAIWPSRPAWGHIGVMLLVGTIMVERSLNGFRKIPFACSYLPGKANLKVTLALYGSLILFLANGMGGIESWALHHLIAYGVLSTVLMIAALIAYRRRSEFANAPHNSLQFDDVAPGAVFSLDLSADRDLTNDDQYVEACRTLGKRLVSAKR